MTSQEVLDQVARNFVQLGAPPDVRAELSVAEGTLQHCHDKFATYIFTLNQDVRVSFFVERTERRGQELVAYVGIRTNRHERRAAIVRFNAQQPN